MKLRYHVNPETGEVSVCHAVVGPCPYSSSLHAGSPEKAEERYREYVERDGNPLTNLFATFKDKVEDVLDEHSPATKRRELEERQREFFRNVSRAGSGPQRPAEAPRPIQDPDYGRLTADGRRTPASPAEEPPRTVIDHASGEVLGEYNPVTNEFHPKC